MTYSLQGKSDKFPSQGQVTVRIAFREINSNEAPGTGKRDGRKSMKFIAEELIQSPGFNSKRTMSLKNIAQALLSERRSHSQCTKKALAENGSELDSNDNEIRSEARKGSHPENSSTLVRVQSARGKVNARREVLNSSDRIYIRQKVISRPRSPTSTETESEEEGLIPSGGGPLVGICELGDFSSVSQKHFELNRPAFCFEHK